MKVPISTTHSTNHRRVAVIAHLAFALPSPETGPLLVQAKNQRA
jgi:hypothetical protein